MMKVLDWNLLENGYRDKTKLKARAKFFKNTHYKKKRNF